jgi:hypothetical protein
MGLSIIDAIFAETDRGFPGTGEYSSAISAFRAGL